MLLSILQVGQGVGPAPPPPPLPPEIAQRYSGGMSQAWGATGGYLVRPATVHRYPGPQDEDDEEWPLLV